MNKDNNKNRIRILMTSDVHGKVFPHSYADGSIKEYGFARLYSTIKKLRDDNTILIDNGDVLEGSPLQLYHMMTDLKDRDPSPVSRVMKAINYDYINLGNHDFNFGPEVLFRHIETSGALCITQNITYQGRSILRCNDLQMETPEDWRKEKCAEGGLDKTYVIKEIAGKRIAIFGLLTHYVKHWESEEHLEGFEFFDALESAKENVARIKANGEADFIVCVYHGGFEIDPETGQPIGKDTGENQGYKILSEIPEIDVFLTGHQHKLIVNTNDGRVFVQPGANGEHIACVDIYPYDLKDGDAINQKCHMEAELIKIETEADEGILDLVRDEEEACQIWLDQIIGETRLDLRVHDEFDARLNKSQLITYINSVQLKYSKADISAVALFQGATGIGPDITIRQIVSTYVFPDNIVVKRINGKILKEYLEQTVAFWDVERRGDTERIIVNPKYEIPTPQYFNYDLLDGVEYTAKVSNPIGERITSLTMGGSPVQEDTELTIAINHYRAAGGGDFFMLSDAETVWVDSTTMIDILVKEIKSIGIIDFKPINNISIEI